MATLADDLSHAGAVMIARGDRVVAAHFGSVTGELSVCLKHAGLAVRSDLDVLELHARADRLELALARLLPDAVPSPGGAVRVGGAWCAHAEPGRALVVGPPGAVASVRRLAAGAALALQCRAPDTTRIELVGPRVRRVLERAGLPADLPPQAVRRCWWREATVVLLCEDRDRFLLLVGGSDAGAAWHDLLAAGRPLELACVGLDALTRLAAAR